jgi:L-aspartate oxidase
MWEHVGIVRNNAGLARAATMLMELDDTFTTYVRHARYTTASCEVRNLLLVATLITRSAQARGESRGTHYNADHPTTASHLDHCDSILCGQGFISELQAQ